MFSLSSFSFPKGSFHCVFLDPPVGRDNFTAVTLWLSQVEIPQAPAGFARPRPNPNRAVTASFITVWTSLFTGPVLLEGKHREKNTSSE